MTKLISKAVTRFGYSELRPMQVHESCEVIYSGTGYVFSLPTGSRKSLCYCILPIIFNLLRCTVGLSIAVVVSPLVALMKEQVSAMELRGLTAVYVRDCDDEGAATNVCRGSFQLVYMTLESMLNDICWRDMLLSPVYQENLVALVVDKPTA